mgnify:CR=1 FL=1
MFLYSQNAASRCGFSRDDVSLFGMMCLSEVISFLEVALARAVLTSD